MVEPAMPVEKKIPSSDPFVLPIPNPFTPALHRYAAKQYKQQERRKKRHPSTCADLSRVYVKSIKTIGQKTNVKLDPAVKRTLCKECNVVLVPGATATVRVKASTTHGNVMVYTCTQCKTIRRIPAPPTLHSVVEEAADATVIAGSEEAVTMNVDAPSDSKAAGPSKRTRKKQKQARVPPLFELDAGHILFKGNEEVSIKDRSRFMCS
ncbi:hypothetical protein EUX98_g5806 [Antrodiella citrinella]|uniref:Rpr2-domain-containing protein n=1 Tax=Antrodiella citrinella TaxID=2447956 RepID=A0A4S4MYB3_9APHY|nr:hypothetical protein EUX98_g5806 [Antrodiella citrinella]